MSSSEQFKDLFQAAQSGDAPHIRQLLQQDAALSTVENGEGLALLGYAAHFGHSEVVQLLLDHGAEINALSHSKVSYIPSNTALHAAIAGERNLAVIELLLAKGADTNRMDSNGHTSLHTAAYHDGNTRIIQLLIEYGAYVHAKDKDGKTPLSLAEERGNHNVAELLRKHGAR